MHTYIDTYVSIADFIIPSTDIHYQQEEKKEEEEK